MSNLYLNNIRLENKFSFSTPKFNQTLQEKDSLIKNTSLGFDLPSFEEQKIPVVKKSNQVLLIPNYTDTNKIAFKNNLSLSSLLNEKNNDDNENNKEKNNNKIEVINMNMEKPNLKVKKEKSLISFGDKSENGNTSLDNNEIIYREKNNNSSSLSNKEKENDKENNNNKENDNGNISLERKTSSNLQNNNSSFQYSLPLENDMEPNVNDFFILEEDNCKQQFNGKDAKKLQNLDNNPINGIKIEKSENDKNNIEIKNIDLNQKKITYSKKKAKMSKTQRASMINKYLPKDEIFNITEEKKTLNNEYKDKNFKKIINKNIFNSCENYKKFRKKMRFCSFDFSSEEIEEENNFLVLSDKNINSNSKIKSPQNKLTIIKKLNLFKIPKITENNCKHVKNYSSRENLDKYKNNLNLDFKNEFKGRNSLNKNIKTEINLNSLYTNKKKFRNLKLDKFSGLFTDFQRHKKLDSKDNLNTLNTFRETENYHNRIKTNILNNNNNYNNTLVANINNNHKKFIIKKNNNKAINSNNKKKNPSLNLNLNNKTRNFDNLIFNNSNKLFNKNFYNTINYENLEVKTIESTNNNNNLNKNKNKEKINKKIINNKIKEKIQIKSQFTNSNNYIKKIHNPKDKKNLKIENKNTKNNNLNNIRKSFYIISNKNKNDINFNKSNNLIFNNQNKPKYKKQQKKFYNKLIYNVIETNKNKDIQKIYQTKNAKNFIINKEKILNKNKDHIINNFINNNFSSNSLQNNRYNRINNRIKSNNFCNKHSKQYTEANLDFQDNSNNFSKIYRKPKNTCLINQFNAENNILTGKKYFIKRNINNNIREIMEYNSGNKTNKNSQIIALRKKFINGSNLTQKNSISKFYDRIHDLNSNQRNSLQKLNINNFYSELRSSPKNENYDDEMIRFSILRNNLNNQIINEFSITVGDKTERSLGNNIKNDIRGENELDINQKKMVEKRDETINDKKTIINVNQYYPSYFINAHNQNFKEKK